MAGRSIHTQVKLVFHSVHRFVRVRQGLSLTKVGVLMKTFCHALCNERFGIESVFGCVLSAALARCNIAHVTSHACSTEQLRLPVSFALTV